MYGLYDRYDMCDTFDRCDMSDMYDLYDLYCLAPRGGWEPYSLPGTQYGTCFPDGVCTTKTRHDIAQRQV